MDAYKKKIVLIGSTSERYKGGIAQFTRYLADQLSAAASVTFFSWFQLYPSFLIRRNFVDTVSQSSTGKTLAHFILGYCFPLSWFRCARRIRDLQPDMVCIGWIHPVHAPIYWFLARTIRLSTRAELVFICFNADPHESFPGAAWLSRLVLSKAHRIVVHGSSEAKSIARLVPGIPITQLFLPLRNFYQGTGRTYQRKGPAGKRLLFFGLIRHYKGLDILLRAMPSVLKVHPDAHLVVAGERFYQKRRKNSDETCSENPESLVNSLGLSDAVTLDLRYIPNEEIPALLDSSDVAIFPYRTATQSGVVAVAYGYGIPVIASRVGGLPDVVAEGISGLLIEPNDPDALALAITEFLNKPISRESVTEFAQQLSWERYVTGLLSGESFVLPKNARGRSSQFHANQG